MRSPTLEAAIESQRVKEEPAVREEEHERGDRARQSDADLARKEPVERRGDEPKLDDDESRDEREDGREERDSLALRVHGQTSRPTAKISSRTTSRRMRGKARVGGPAVGRPLVPSNQPWWQGQKSLF